MDSIDNIFKTFPLLETKRFNLVEITEKFKQDLIQLMSDDESMKYNNSDFSDVVKEVEMYLKKIAITYKVKRSIRWAIIDKNSNDFIGDIGLYNIDFNSNNVEISYIVDKKHWNNGVATECIETLLDFTFNILKMNKLITIIDDRNISSIKLIEKFKFHKDGVLREQLYSTKEQKYINLCIYSLLEKERSID